MDFKLNITMGDCILDKHHRHGLRGNKFYHHHGNTICSISI